MSEYFLIAKVISTSGNSGFVSINLFTDFPERLFVLKKIYIDFFNEKKEFLVEEVKRSDKYFTMKLRNFNDSRDAEILIGKDIFIDEKDLLKLPANQFFIHDLLGSRVLRNNVEIGEIKDVLSLPANDVYIIADKNGKEILIPAVKQFVESFDPQKKILLLTPGEELYESDED